MEFFGKCGAVRILKAGAQSVSRGRVLLRISKKCEVGTVELDVLRRDGERVVLQMGWIDGDLCGLDLRELVLYCGSRP